MPTIFYVIGIALVVLAVATSALGLRNTKFPSSRFAMAGGLLLFIGLVAATTTAAVINANDQTKEHDENVEAAARQEADIAKLEGQGESGPANVAAPSNAGPTPSAGANAGTASASPSGGASSSSSSGGGSSLNLSADPTQLAYNTDSLSAKAGKVTINFDNPSATSHDVVIEGDGKEIAKTDLISKGKTSVSANLKPGKYTYFCDVPGHEQAGMKGTLTVK
jgi:plastocyanin